MVCGHTNAAHRLFSWLRGNAITSKGDLGPSTTTARRYYYAYEKSWLIETAYRLGQFDIVSKGMEFMIDFWDPKSVGFCSIYDGRDANTLQDLWGDIKLWPSRPLYWHYGRRQERRPVHEYNDGNPTRLPEPYVHCV